MEYELRFSPFMPTDGWKYKVIQITDVALHTSRKQPTLVGKKISQAFQSMKPGRIYSPIQHTEATSSPKNNNIVMDLIKKDPEFIKMIQEEEKNGYKILIEIPNQIPVIAGKDTIEFIASINGKRILRKIAEKHYSD